MHEISHTAFVVVRHGSTNEHSGNLQCISNPQSKQGGGPRFLEPIPSHNAKNVDFLAFLLICKNAYIFICIVVDYN